MNAIKNRSNLKITNIEQNETYFLRKNSAENEIPLWIRQRRISLAQLNFALYTILLFNYPAYLFIHKFERRLCNRKVHFKYAKSKLINEIYIFNAHIFDSFPAILFLCIQLWKWVVMESLCARGYAWHCRKDQSFSTKSHRFIRARTNIILFGE